MKKPLALIGILFVAACNEPATVVVTPEKARHYPDAEQPKPVTYASRLPDSAFRNPGDPERLLDRATEVVTMSLGSRGALSDISQMVTQDPPTRAELNCSSHEALCMEARSMFVSRHIPVEFTGNGDDVTLVYERVVARDCDSRFVDNTRNGQNAMMPQLGCSVLGNTMQMVSDKGQFTDPSLMDLQDGEKAVQTYRRYRMPPPPPGESQSILRAIKTD